VVAEALTNVLKHARAQQATVTGSVDDGMLNIEIRDDGIGGANPAGNGLVGIEDRVSALGGQLRVECPACGGTVGERSTADRRLAIATADSAGLSTPTRWARFLSIEA
jgi:glucose-6-phosphate-specific signal transduction histidine kinase